MSRTTDRVATLSFALGLLLVMGGLAKRNGNVLPKNAALVRRPRPSSSQVRSPSRFPRR